MTTSSRLNVVIPQGFHHLSVFVIGGGGAADGATAGSSGFFKHQILDVDQTQSYVLDVTIGVGGGRYSGESGQSTTVKLSSISGSDTHLVSAQGGGGSGGPGWSGVGGVNGDVGGFNGKYGTGERLPNLCSGVNLTPGQAGYNRNDGAGAGGVVVDGRKPRRTDSRDGEGFGAGGGEDRRFGFPGVAVLSLCETEFGSGLGPLDQEHDSSGIYMDM